MVGSERRAQSSRCSAPAAPAVERMRQRLVEEGLEAALTRKTQERPLAHAYLRRRGGGQADCARLLAAPQGRARWTLELLEEKVVALGIVERASDNTIGRTLKKNALKPHLRRQWVIPPDANAAFVAAMEDVLEVYHRPHDPHRPLVCLDETSKQLIRETRKPIAMRPGQPARHDYEYERSGVATSSCCWRARRLAPGRGLRPPRRLDYAQVLKDLADMHFPEADRIVLVQDNLSTHTPASLYAAFPARRGAPPRRALRMALHAQARSWMNMAEGELAVLAANASIAASRTRPT